MNLYLEAPARLLDVAEKVSLSLAKELEASKIGFVEDNDVMIGVMFAAVIHGFDTYRLEKTHETLVAVAAADTKRREG